MQSSELTVAIAFANICFVIDTIGHREYPDSLVGRVVSRYIGRTRQTLQIVGLSDRRIRVRVLTIIICVMLCTNLKRIQKRYKNRLCHENMQGRL